MGCTASRVASEDTVRRCRERRRLMKEAVLSRNQLASAHADYLHALRLTGSALTRFASFQSLSVSDQTPPVLLHPPPPPPPPPAPPLSIPTSTPAPSARSSGIHLPRTSPASFPFPTFPTTPSQSSSAWNWEAHYPPSPPGSDYYDRLDQERNQQKDQDAKNGNQHHLLEETDEEEGEAIRCSDWGERRSISSSTSRSEAIGEEDDVMARSDLRGSAVGRELQVVVRHRNLKEIVEAIEECFVKAATAGGEMSGLLENGRKQLDGRSLRQLKKTVYHSSSLLSNISSSWTSRPPLAVKYQLDMAAAMEDGGGGKSHCSTLERLLAWEKKLYQEVKAKEAARLEHKRKLSTLQTLECRSKDETKLIKTKAAIQKLQSLILVTSEAVTTTSSTIFRVRDDELAPQLVEICLGFLNMWRSMKQFHEVQNHIVQQVRGLASYSAAVESTSDLHRQATCELESAISDWHSSFTRLIKFHRDYIRSIHAWLKLTLIEVGNERSEDFYSALVSSELSTFCDEWKQALERIPDTVAAEALKSFVNVVHSISIKQTEELKIKKRVENYSKQLEKKSVALRRIEMKFYRSYSTLGIALRGGGPDTHGQVFDARDPLAEKKIEVAACRRKVEDEMSKHTKAIGVTRDATLNNIQTGLPGVFQAISGFSGLFTEALEGVCRHARP